jgi:two-component system LytT family response regulator
LAQNINCTRLAVGDRRRRARLGIGPIRFCRRSLSGFDVLAQSRLRPRIIFVTAHDEFAVRAFEEQALDYLLKPVEPERIARALARLTAVVIASSTKMTIDRRLDRLLEVVGRPRPLVRRIAVRAGSRITLVDVAAAVLFRAEDKYSMLYTIDAEHMLDRTIDELARTLDPEASSRFTGRRSATSTSSAI